MSAMVERAARALRKASCDHLRRLMALNGMIAVPLDMKHLFLDYDTCNEDDREANRIMARASCAAMREPTEAMILAGLRALNGAHEDVERVWQAMVDETLT